MGAFGSLGGSGMSHTLLPYGFVKRCVLCGGVLCQVSPSQGYFPPLGCSVGLWMWVCAGVSFRVGAAVRCQFLTACSLFSPPLRPTADFYLVNTVICIYCK